MYYPLELTILKSVSKDFNHLVSYFKNDFDMDKLKLILHYYEYVISNKYYGLLNELKGCPVLFDDGLNILSSVSNNLECVIYFINNPSITYKPELINSYELNSNTIKILNFVDFDDYSIINFVLHKTTDETVKNYLDKYLNKIIHSKIMVWFKNSSHENKNSNYNDSFCIIC
jgi:hypothetical protein